MWSDHYRTQLPAEYRSEDVFPYLSYDAQVYYACARCRREYRLNHTVNLVPPVTYDGRDCPSGDGGSLRLVVHRFLHEALCHDCGRQWNLRTTGFDPVMCPQCHSRDFFRLSTWLRPPFPARFHELTPLGAEPRAHEWGQDADADAQLVPEQLEYISLLPNPAQYLVPAILFLNRLRVCNAYDPARSWVLTNLHGLLLREYYRQTGELTAGTEAVQVFNEISEASADPFQRGLILHNVSMAAYSLLARRPPELLLYGGAEHYRSIGTDAAHRAIACYESLQATADAALGESLRLQIARVQHVLADLLKAGTPSPAALTEALSLLDRVVAEPALPEDMRIGALRSRAAVVQQAGDRAGAPSGQVLDDLSASLPDLENLPLWEQHSLLASLAQYRESTGDLAGAVDFQQRAATVAEDALIRADDETSLGQVGRQYGHTFDLLARIEAKRGRPRAALAAVETVRAATVRFGHQGETEAMRRHEAELTRFFGGRAGEKRLESELTQFLGDGPGKQQLEGGLTRFFSGGSGNGVRPDTGPRAGEEGPTAEALAALHRAGWPQTTAFCMLSGAAGETTAVIAMPDGTERWEVRGLQWAVSERQIMRMTRGINLEHGPFREERLAAACAAARRVFFDKLLPQLRDWGADGLAISAPGLFSHVPYEAVPISETGMLGDEFEVFYLPSLQLGAMLRARYDGLGSGRRALAVMHGGEGLPGARYEVERMAELWGDRLDVLNGAEHNKGDVLDALSGDYDVVHFACHGSFDLLQPLESALYLTNDRDRDARKLTAGDLMGTSFARAPVVTLAACESGLTSYGMTSDCTGLTGGLLRMGARGVIASRWAVTTGEAGQELAAERFTNLVHRSLVGGAGISGRQAVTSAQRELARQGYGIEDWAAFSYLGIP
ncbi:CHAT domain-containing protein [Streptomyces sp. NBC_00481]|uniref:CHAT domain-containing protein n=1 Tax=Streptomyces sp. NBC_00481 TaxID=2975755 RepID=UPI002DD9AD93|nr:CHAT domain-containing protein [Streptomyces sp. NBC_00481]WRZ01175.1 CHAT domain-containing protein [Streptomyces sp. NBC_00481]